jgi:hypothetical protein
MGVSDPVVYTLMSQVLQAVLRPLHATSFVAVSSLVWAVLCAQSLHPAEVVRALPDLATAHARQGFRRVQRGLTRGGLTSEALTPHLVGAVLRLVGEPEALLVLDSSRCGCWEIFTLGVRCGGRVLPVGWQVLPYPWPNGQYTPTTLTLLDRVMGCWPAERAVHLVADRGFPSRALVRRLDAWRRWRRLGYTLRLTMGAWVTLTDGRTVRLADLVGHPSAGRWRTWTAHYPGCRTALAPTYLVAGRGLPVWPRHQCGPADQARRQARAQRRAAHLLSKGQAQAVATDTVWCLLTTETTWPAAVTRYSGRFSTEGTYRDLKAWGWETRVSALTEVTVVEGLTGLAVLSYVVQVELGLAAGRTQAAGARARQRQWTTTDRLSPFSRGRLVLHDQAHDWRPWLQTALAELTQALSAVPAATAAVPAAGQPPALQEAA